MTTKNKTTAERNDASKELYIQQIARNTRDFSFLCAAVNYLFVPNNNFVPYSEMVVQLSLDATGSESIEQSAVKWVERIGIFLVEGTMNSRFNENS